MMWLSMLLKVCRGPNQMNGDGAQTTGQHAGVCKSGDTQCKVEAIGNEIDDFVAKVNV